MRSTLLAALALLPVSAFATISITGPSATSYWVQNTSNVITWTFTAGDPSPVDILVVNSDNTTLNGAFSIARFVDVSAQSVTVTNVTLKSGGNYAVEFVNTTNPSQVYATSNTFSVMPPGTAPAPTSSVASSASAFATNSSSAPSASNTTPGSSSAAASTSPVPTPVNAAPSTFGSGSTSAMLAACAVAALTAAFL